MNNFLTGFLIGLVDPLISNDAEKLVLLVVVSFICELLLNETNAGGFVDGAAIEETNLVCGINCSVLSELLQILLLFVNEYVSFPNLNEFKHEPNTFGIFALLNETVIVVVEFVDDVLIGDGYFDPTREVDCFKLLSYGLILEIFAEDVAFDASIDDVWLFTEMLLLDVVLDDEGVDWDSQPVLFIKLVGGKAIEVSLDIKADAVLFLGKYVVVDLIFVKIVFDEPASGSIFDNVVDVGAAAVCEFVFWSKAENDGGTSKKLLFALNLLLQVADL